MASLKRRGKTYYAQYYVGSKQKRICLRTESYQVAREKIRKLESSLARGDENPLPSRTSIADAVTAYVEHIRTVKTPKSAQTDVYYLRSAFGPVCDVLKVNSRKQSVRAMKKPPKAKPGQDRRCRTQRIEAQCFEQITTADIAAFIASQVRSRGLAPKTANRYREILCRLFNWSMSQGGIRMPADKNPAAQVERYKQKASQISYLTLKQIDEQLDALADDTQLQTIVAMYIYAGLRREEALWLTLDDIDLHAGSNGMIRIQAKTVAGEYWQPKTSMNRAVPISRALRTYLDSYAPRPSIGAWFFPSPKGRHYDPDNFSRDLRTAQIAASLKWTCLDFRHTFGSQLASNSESLYMISSLMGNSPEICRTHYAALIPEALAECVEFTPRKKRKKEAVSVA